MSYWWTALTSAQTSGQNVYSNPEMLFAAMSAVCKAEFVGVVIAPMYQKPTFNQTDMATFAKTSLNTFAAEEAVMVRLDHGP